MRINHLHRRVYTSMKTIGRLGKLSLWTLVLLEAQVEATRVPNQFFQIRNKATIVTTCQCKFPTEDSKINITSVAHKDSIREEKIAVTVEMKMDRLTNQ